MFHVASLPIRACFLYFCIFQQKRALEKWWKIFSIKFFYSQNIQIFVLSLSSLFPSAGYCWIHKKGWLKINPKICDIVMCLNSHLKIQIMKYFQKEDLKWKLGHAFKKLFHKEDILRNPQRIYLYFCFQTRQFIWTL